MLLEAKGLSYSYETLLFEDLNLSLKAGSSLAIKGSSGSGKSTLLHILSSLLEPKAGEVFFNLKSIYKENEKSRLKIRRDDFGIIFQTHYLFKGFSAFENIELASILSGKDIDYDICEKLGIAHLLANKVTKLSGGEQQRISIARVLCKRPKIIFADEPTGNLDLKNAKNVMEILLEYTKSHNAGLVFVTHDDHLARFCDESLVLSEGF